MQNANKLIESRVKVNNTVEVTSVTLDHKEVVLRHPTLV